MLADKIAIFLPYLVLGSHLIFISLVLFILFRHSWGKAPFKFLAEKVMVLGLVISLFAIFGSLFYSETIGFEPCVLCWWQRVFLYPQTIIFAVALWKKKRDAFLYIVPMTLIALAISAYQVYANFTGDSLLSCTALDGSCSKIYVNAFGYITIPVMSLTVSLFILLLVAVSRIYKNEEDSFRSQDSQTPK